MRFTETNVIAISISEFEREGWTYDGFIPGPQTTAGTGVAVGPVGFGSSAVDRELYLLFSKPGAVEAPPRLAAWGIQVGRRKTDPFVDRMSIIDESDLDDILGPDSN